MSRARIVFDEMLRGSGVGELATYLKAGELLDLDPIKDLGKIRAAIRQAGKWLLEEENRAIDVVPGTGYRVVEAREHITLHRRQQKKSQRALQRGQAALENVRIEDLDEMEKRIVQAGLDNTALQLDMYRRFGRDQKRLEKGLALESERGDRTEAEVDKLKERIARLESGRRS